MEIAAFKAAPSCIPINSFLNRFKFAIRGIRILVREEPSMRIHFAISLLVIVLGMALKLSSLEWVSLSICMGIVISLEAVNTAVEKLSDHISPGWNDVIGKVKDLSAGAVLISAIAAIVVGGIIFIPKVWLVFGA